jgi:hypothetical protein
VATRSGKDSNENRARETTDFGDYCGRQSSSASRVAAGALGFLTFTQCAERPERYGEPSRFDTMPSQPSLEAYLNTISPSPSDRP